MRRLGLDVADYIWTRPVIARRMIRQCPTSTDLDVPAGRPGWLQDVADGLLWIDFGDGFGVVPCEPSEVLQ